MKSAMPDRSISAEMLSRSTQALKGRRWLPVLRWSGLLSSMLLWSVLVLPLAAPAQVHAGQQAQPQNFAKPVGGVTLEQAAAMVRRQTGGRVLSATPVNKNGERGYNVRVLVDGKRVKQYYVDAEGRMSSR